MRDGYLRGVPSRPATQRQVDVLAAYVAAGGSVPDTAVLMGIQPSTVKRHLADLRARSGLTTEQLIYAGRAAGWLVVPSLEPSCECQFLDSDSGAGGGAPGIPEAGEIERSDWAEPAPRAKSTASREAIECPAARARSNSAEPIASARVATVRS